MEQNRIDIMEINGEYLSDRGDIIRRENCVTPGGNHVNGLWVMRSSNGDFVDFDQYRHDLFDRHGMKEITP